MPKEELLIAGKGERERGRASRRDDDDDDDGSSRCAAMPGPGTAAGDTKMDGGWRGGGEWVDAWMGPKGT